MKDETRVLMERILEVEELGGRKFSMFNEFIDGVKLASMAPICYVRREGALIFVASLGVAGDWAVYYSNNPSWTPLNVAENGTKATETLARALFPQLSTTLKWRR